MRVLLRTGSLAAALLIVAAGCVKKVETRPLSAGGSGVAPGLVLEQFLRAANAAARNDSTGVGVMGRLFGTKDGPAVEERDVVEQRMFLIASILKHDDYKLLGEQIVPGRMNEARQINVELVMGQRKVTVPFTMVRAPKDTWLVEEIALGNITAQR